MELTDSSLAMVGLKKKKVEKKNKIEGIFVIIGRELPQKVVQNIRIFFL